MIFTLRHPLKGCPHERGARMKLGWYVAGAASLLAASVAFAEPQGGGWGEQRVSPIGFEIGDWTFTPIYWVDDNGNHHVDQFLATLHADVVVGHNLTAVWYFRDGDEWSRASWAEQNPWLAVEYVSQHNILEDTADLPWGLEDDPEWLDNPQAAVPQAYANGVLADDPLSEVLANTPNSDALLDILVQGGYPAALILPESTITDGWENRIENLALFAGGLIENNANNNSDDMIIIDDDDEIDDVSENFVIVRRTPWTDVGPRPNWTPAGCRDSNGIVPGFGWYLCYDWTRCWQEFRTRTRSIRINGRWFQCMERRERTRCSTTSCCINGNTNPGIPPQTCPPAWAPPPGAQPTPACRESRPGTVSETGWGDCIHIY